MKADFFVRLAQGGVEQGRIDGVNAAAGKRDLSAMARHVIGAADIDDVKVAGALEQRYQYGGGVPFVRERLTRGGSDGCKLASNSLDVAGKRRVEVVIHRLQIIASSALLASAGRIPMVAARGLTSNPAVAQRE